MLTTVYLIRHGETEWNVTGRWQGHTDVPLNDIGRTQASLLAQHLSTAGARFDVIYSSDLTRAYQTAWEIGAAVRVPVQLLPPLREIDLGSWSGLTRDEIRSRYPVEFELLERGQDIPRGGAETLSALRNRVVTAIEALVARHSGETMALVSHGGVIRMMLAHVYGFDSTRWKELPHIANTSITILQHHNGAWQIALLNDTRHLEQAVDMPDLISIPPDDAARPLPLDWNP